MDFVLGLGIVMKGENKSVKGFLGANIPKSAISFTYSNDSYNMKGENDWHDDPVSAV